MDYHDGFSYVEPSLAYLIMVNDEFVVFLDLVSVILFNIFVMMLMSENDLKFFPCWVFVWFRYTQLNLVHGDCGL